MLLRLLPAPTQAQANPPTILFTLPAPTQPYTARSLPLPPNLLAHRSVCLQEDLDCPNVLLGDKASWITGIIDDVTFSLVSQSVTVNFIDGTQRSYPIDSLCAGQLHRVCREVELSFAPSAAVTPTPESTPVHSRQSSGNGPSSPMPSARRSPSSLLLSLLSPLLPSASPAHIARIPPARVHRRQARSILVDTFRRFVMPTLKAELPSAYLPWTVASETKRRMEEFEGLRAEVDRILAETGVEKGNRAPLKRYRTFSSGSESDDDMSIDSIPSDASSPATSVCSSVNASSPQSFLLSIPPAHALPSTHQQTYTLLLQRLTHIASRLHSITRLNTRYEKEESKRAWLESLERGRAVDKALRRAWSNGELKKEVVIAKGIRSGLWRSITAEDVKREEERAAAYLHPAMMEEEEEEPEMTSSDDDDVESISSLVSPVTPQAPTFAAPITIRLPVATALENYEDLDTALPLVPLAKLVTARPILVRAQQPADESISEEDESESDSDQDGHPLPSLSASSSTESLSSGDWDAEVRTPSPPLSDRRASNSSSDSHDEMPLRKTAEIDIFTWAPMDEASRPKSRLGFRRRADEMEVVVA